MAFQEVFTGSDWISYPRIKHLSNPDVTKNGQPTGIAGERENWEVLQQTNNTVADFENPNELRASITYSNSDSWYNFTSHTCGGSGSLSYQWQTSYGDPFHFGAVVSTSSSYSVGLLPGTWYIRLTGSSSGGQTFVTTTTVEVEESDGGGGGGEPCQSPCDGPQPKVIADGDRQMEQELPDRYSLQPAYPNPFNPTTQLNFTLPERAPVTVRVYNLAGRQVATLTDRPYPAGRHTLRFNGGGLASGTYLVHLQAGDFAETRRVTLIK